MSVAIKQADPALLGIYLNDHFAGAAGGLALARRLAHNHRDTPAGAPLGQVAQQTAEDRDTLRELMSALGVAVSRHKLAAAWLAEKVGRLKLNGRLLRRSPLSSVLELEAMLIGVEGKAAGWRALRPVASFDGRLDLAQLDRLLERARWQRETLEQARMQAAREVFVEEALPG